MTRVPWLCAVLCALALACRIERTQIILAVDTDMTQGPGRELTHMRIRVVPTGSSQARYANVFALDPTRSNGTFRLPATLGIAALDNDGRRTVDIQVTAIRAPTAVRNVELSDTRYDHFTARAIVPFQQEKTVGVGVFLYRECIGSRCDPGDTCDRGLCVDARRAGVEVDPNGAFDAATLVPPPRDGSPAVPRADVIDDLSRDATPDVSTDASMPEDTPPPSDIFTCPTGMTACEGACVDLTRDLRHCGRCRNECPSHPRSTATCAEGVCGLMCMTGLGDCDGDRINGCETDLMTAVAHCGACGMACSIVNGTAACARGVCVRANCNAGFSDCDMDSVNGCEVNLGMSAAHCGSCGRTCSLANATSACAAGACTIASCNAGFADCDGNPANGCEVDIRTSVTNCGMCGRACSFANATAACAMGACVMGTCAAGFSDCDMSPANGCETDTRTSNAHCGACGRACVTGQMCSGTPPACATVCAAPTTMCAGRCVLLASDTRDCGRCGNVCPAPPNAVATCAAGACEITCNAGFDNCDGNAANGCEVNLATTLAHCGGCGMACAPANATGVCTAGRCGIGACNAGFGNCDGNPNNGCETDLRASVSNCGACGNTCTFANATATCTAGRCAVETCNAGFGNCNGNVGDGCETALGSNLAHCGRCGNVCMAPAGATATCNGAACGFVCRGEFRDCDGMSANGCEVDTATSGANCGACGTRCVGPTNCSAGICIDCTRAGDVCSDGTLCCAPSQCRQSISTLRCCVQADQVCTNDLQCCGYMLCVGGACACQGNGRGCRDSSECCSGFTCQSNGCRPRSSMDGGLDASTDVRTGGP